MVASFSNDRSVVDQSPYCSSPAFPQELLTIGRNTQPWAPAYRPTNEVCSCKEKVTVHGLHVSGSQSYKTPALYKDLSDSYIKFAVYRYSGPRVSDCRCTRQLQKPSSSRASLLPLFDLINLFQQESSEWGQPSWLGVFVVPKLHFNWPP